MRNDQIFVLLLVVLLPMSGCFDGGTAGVGEAEGAQDSGEASETTVVNNYYNNTTTSSNIQERTWYSSGDTYFTYWNDGQDVSSGLQRCLDWGPVYDSSNGTYIGENCRETGYPTEASDWNVTNCTERGGQVDWSQYDSIWDFYQAPRCVLELTTITTAPGEALLIYQKSGLSMNTVCEGVSLGTASSLTSGAEYAIVPGSALECTHKITISTAFSINVGYAWGYADRQSAWSIVYAIQDTTVV